MPTVEIAVTAYSAQSANPDRRYGQLAALPLLNGASNVYFRAPLTAKIPAGATVTAAKVRFWERSAETGDRTLNLQPVSSGWTSNVTWANRPSTSGTVVAVTKSSPQPGDLWEWDVTAAAQEVVSGTRIDRGWRLVADAANANVLTLKGSTAATQQPVLVVTYTLVPLAPENLHPASGAVSVAKPVVTFDAAEDITALQVQVDPAMNGTTPGFDSGTVAAAGGFLDLSSTTYAGLAAGASTFWRARQQNASGWSEWSDWVSMSRLAKPTLSITSPPAGAVEDPTPPVQWSLTGGTQTAWQARLLDAAGDVLADSGYIPGADTSWTPVKGFKKDGQQGTIELRVWDGQDRAAVPGDPEYVMVTRSVTYTLDPTVDPVDTIAASQANGDPEVVLTGTRTLGAPDEVVVFRNGEQIATYVGTDVFSGTSFTITDARPILGRPATYRVAPKTTGVGTASGGPTATITPHATGIWLVDDATGDRALIYTETGAPEQAQPETAIVHTPLGEVDGLGQVVRRRLIRYRPQGKVTGVLMDGDAETLLREWADNDAGHRYWLAFSGFTGYVIIGDVEFPERDNPRQERSREVGVSFNYWGQAS